MEAKSIIDDPQAAIATHWGSEEACPTRHQIEALVERISELKAAIKHSKDHKGRISRQFREAKDDPEHFKQLKRDMAAVSGKLQAQEKERKELEAELLEHFQQATTENKPAPFPARFDKRCPQRDISPAIMVEEVDHDCAAEWDRYVNEQEASSLYHLYGWRQVVEKSFGHRCHYYVARQRDGQIVGLLPLVVLESRLFGRYAVSLPFFNYGGALANDRRIEAALMEAAGAEARRQQWEHIEYRTCDPALELPSRDKKVSMILRLPSSAQELDESLRAKVRAQYKQAERHEPEIAFGGLELLDDYYAVFSRNMRDLGTPVYSKALFREILQTFPEHCTLVTVRLNGKRAAAAFLAGYKDMLEIPWASTLREFNDFNINMWMYRQILGFAIDRSYAYFDFGRSTEGAGTFNFKKQWGAKPLWHYWYYDLLSGNAGDPQLPELNPDNPKYQLAIRAWQRLPLLVANALGPHIVKNLP